MKCEELLALLNEYVDGTVDPAICTEFEKHLAGCNPCQVVVDNIRQTITLFVHHYWLFFTMFVGANLLQSGITKWCLMEDILRKVGVGRELACQK